MNDKIKGLVAGLVIGSTIAGSAAAFASGAQIEVLYRPLRLLFDGTEKAPAEGKVFIHEGSTYAPLRFISEAVGKEVEWDEATGTIRIDEPGSRTVLLTAEDAERNHTLTTGELNAYLSLLQLYNPSHSQYAADPGYREQMAREALSFKIILGRASEAEQTRVGSLLEKRLTELKAGFERAFAGRYTWEQRLKELKLTETQVLNHLKNNELRMSYLQSLVTTDVKKQAYETKAKAGDYDTATVRHILVGFESSDGKTRSKEEAAKTAREILTKLRAGLDFAEAAKTYSDDPGSKDNGGRYEKADIGLWVAAFKEAVRSQEIGKIGEPVETEYGYHVIQVESRQTKAFEEVEEELAKQLLDESYSRFMEEELPSLLVTSANP